MNGTVHYDHCPACLSQAIQPVLTAKDHVVSGESFNIWQCDNCSLRFTQDVPGPGRIGQYYKSEDYISHTNTSKGLINRLYKVVRKTTLRRKRRLVCDVTKKRHGDLLDVGSGTGAFVDEMRTNGWNVVGLEPDEDARKAAGGKADLRDINELFNLHAASFDGITLWHVLEHVHDLENYLQQFRKLLRPDGTLIVAVPNYTCYDAVVYKEHWAAYDVPRHLYHFSPLSMKLLMEKNGMEIISYRPMWFDSIYISLLSTKYKNAGNDSRQSGNADWFAAIWNGLRSNVIAMRDVKKCSSIIYIIKK